MDNLTSSQRKKNMKHILSKNTKPEKKVRSYLHRMGYRFRIHVKELPGKPDIVLPKYKTIIFVNGCFWHRHENCKYASIPSTNVVYWTNKFKKNIERDKNNYDLLMSQGWKVIILWECELKRKESFETTIQEKVIKHLLKV